MVVPNLKSGEEIALLNQEGSGIAKRIRHQEKAGGSQAIPLEGTLRNHPGAHLLMGDPS
jgi:hypothetical protein